MFNLIPDFDERTRGGARCSACGSIKQKHHTHVARGEMVEMEGFYDICESCVLQLGHEIGMVTPEVLQETTDANTTLNNEVKAAITLLENEKTLNEALAAQIARQHNEIASLKDEKEKDLAPIKRGRGRNR